MFLAHKASQIISRQIKLYLRFSSLLLLLQYRIRRLRHHISTLFFPFHEFKYNVIHYLRLNCHQPSPANHKSYIFEPPPFQPSLLPRKKKYHFPFSYYLLYFSLWIQASYNSIMSSQNQTSTQKQQQETLKNNSIYLLRGGLIGATISAFVSWNGGRYNRIGAAIKRSKFIRNFISTKEKPLMPIATNYYTPVLDTVMNNFFCFSGQAGIGKSYHFQNLSYLQSQSRPTFYLAFKSSGKETTFQEDLAEQVGYKDCPGILSEIIKAVKTIHEINKSPYRLWTKFATTSSLFFVAAYFLGRSKIQATIGMGLFSLLGISFASYINYMFPFLIQSFRRTVPLVIFDDLNKIQHLGMLSEIVRFLQVLQNNMANVVLVSSDEETWSRLRREPGVKDRLRLRHFIYDHSYTAKILLEMVEKDYEKFMKFISGNKHYTKQIVNSLIKELIGKRQVTLRRFISILKLNDEEEYEKLVEVLENNSNLMVGEIVQSFTDILYDSQMETMVASIKTIKREFQAMSNSEFLEELKELQKKGKLKSDSKMAPHLKAFNIVRDLRSQYVFNGRFVYTVFTMAIKEYEKDMKDFQSEQQSPKSEQLIEGKISENQQKN